MIIAALAAHEMPLQPDADILEVTLRDGSYLIDFQFTAEDTAVIASALQGIGVRWIEVGHGVGMNGSSVTQPAAAATDEEYLEAAASVLDRAKWGMFFIPGIGRPEDLRLAARYGMSFVRIGTNVTQTEQARASIELAKELGMLVSYNAMKSYAVEPAEFARRAAEVRGYGADIVCLVDSAGSFDGETIAAYLRATRQETDAALGFHGHDNLSMAVANSLRAFEEGAVLVDASLQGMGRSAGNAITEILIGVLQQRGLLQHIDLKGAMDVGHALIQPLLGRRGVDPLAVTAGLARFHSSFMPKVAGYARKHEIDVRDLIVRLCQEDQVSAPDELLEELSRDLAAQKLLRTVHMPAWGRTRAKTLPSLLADLRSRATKSGKFAALNVVRDERKRTETEVSGNVQSTAAHVLGVVTVGTPEQWQEALSAADGAVDVVLLDVDPYAAFEGVEVPRLERTKVLTYRDSRIWVDAVEDQAARLLYERLEDTTIVIFGSHAKSRRAALRFAERNARVVVVGDHLPEPAFAALSFQPRHELRAVARGSADADRAVGEARLVVVWPEGVWPETDSVDERDLRTISADAFVLDAAIGGMTPAGQDAARARGAQPLRVNLWPQLGAALESAHETWRVREQSLGWGQLGGVAVVSGGAIGRAGEVIVDSVREPSRVIGIADGRGGVIFQPSSAEETARVATVREVIFQHLMAPRFDS